VHAVFGVSFGEALLLMLLAVIVIGPRNLPQVATRLGRGVAKLRRMAGDLRQQSGIDDILRAEGIEREVRDLQKLATGRILELGIDDPEPDASPAVDPPMAFHLPPRSREYPEGGVDAADALPEDAADYAPPRIAPAEGAVSRGPRSYRDDPAPGDVAPTGSAS
jgi:sec-independent protein translocase protein TatB